MHIFYSYDADIKRSSPNYREDLLHCYLGRVNVHPVVGGVVADVVIGAASTECGISGSSIATHSNKATKLRIP